MALREAYEKCKKLDPKIWIASYVLVSALLLYWYPLVQVSHFEINNATNNATLENQFRTTLAQILGGGAVAIGIYFAWKNFLTAQENLKVAQKGQINERFTRAIDQLGAIDQLANPSLEIRLGGIYALEGIANESEEYYWPIMEILTAYVRKNSSISSIVNGSTPTIEPISMDIQANEFTKKEVPKEKPLSLDNHAVLTVLGRRKYTYNNDEFERLNLSKTFLNRLTLSEAHFEGTDFKYSYLQKTFFEKIHFEKADFTFAHLEDAELRRCNLEGACFENGHFEDTLPNLILKRFSLEMLILKK